MSHEIIEKQRKWLDEAANESQIGEFLRFVDAAQAEKESLQQWLDSLKVSKDPSFFLADYITDPARAKIVSSGSIPGFRRVPAGYGGTEFQTIVKYDTLLFLCNQAKKFVEAKKRKEDRKKIENVADETAVYYTPINQKDEE